MTTESISQQLPHPRPDRRKFAPYTPRSLRLLPRSSEIMDGSVPNILGSPNNVGLSTFIIFFLMT